MIAGPLSGQKLQGRPLGLDAFGVMVSLADEFSPEVGHENSPLRFVSGFWPG